MTHSIDGKCVRDIESQFLFYRYLINLIFTQETIFWKIVRAFFMSYKKMLHYWQFSIVNWLRQMKQEKNINDCIYANYMNLNKTWMMIVFCITINFICERFFIFLLQKFFRLFDCYFLDFVKNFHSWFVYHWRENLSQLFCLSLTRKSFTIFFIDHSIIFQRTQ